MQPNMRNLILLLIFVSHLNRVYAVEDKAFPFVYTSGQDHSEFIVLGKNKIPIDIDDSSSDWLAAKKNIHVFGHLTANNRFVLKHWWILVPFITYPEADTVVVEPKRLEVRRWHLRRSDFLKSIDTGFDPDNPGFDPRKHEKRIRSWREKRGHGSTFDSLPVDKSSQRLWQVGLLAGALAKLLAHVCRFSHLHALCNPAVRYSCPPPNEPGQRHLPSVAPGRVFEFGLLQSPTALDEHGLVAVAEQPAPSPVTHVEAPGKGVLEPLHARYQICLWRLDQKMIMVPHQHPCMHLPTGFFAGLAECPQEEAPVIVVQKDRFPPVAPRHHMIESAGILDANASSHAEDLYREWQAVKN